MKFLLLALLLASGSSYAAGRNNDKSTGCGMGWRVTKGMNTSATSTRNSTNTTFLWPLGMTFGTSGCDYHSIVEKEKERIHFVENNMVPLQYEVALGKGERLDAIGEIFGCQVTALPLLRTTLRGMSGEIFNTNSPAGVVEAMTNVISRDSQLSGSCLI